MTYPPTGVPVTRVLVPPPIALCRAVWPCCFLLPGFQGIKYGFPQNSSITGKIYRNKRSVREKRRTEWHSVLRTNSPHVTSSCRSHRLDGIRTQRGLPIPPPRCTNARMRFPHPPGRMVPSSGQDLPVRSYRPDGTRTNAAPMPPPCCTMPAGLSYEVAVGCEVVVRVLAHDPRVLTTRSRTRQERFPTGR